MAIGSDPMNSGGERPARWTGATSWWGGVGALEEGLPRTTPGGRVRIVVDIGFASSNKGGAFLRRLLTEPTIAGSEVDLIEHEPRRTTLENIATTHAEWQKRPTDMVVIVGGGSTLDFGMLCTLSSDLIAVVTRARGRSGLIVLPPPLSISGLAVRVAIPTTVGTGAEVSAAACADRAGEKMLVVGDWLRPDIAICDPEATEGLSVQALRYAAVEILARLVVPYTTSRPENAHSIALDLSDEILIANTRALLRLSRKLADGAPFSTRDRIALSAAGAHSHAGWGHLGRMPNSSPVWFVGTELSRRLSITKAHATAILLPAWEATVNRGGREWGDPARLRRLGAMALAENYGWSGRKSARWVGDLVAALIPDMGGLSVSPGRHGMVAAEVADESARRWGRSLPALGSMPTASIEALVAESLATTD